MEADGVVVAPASLDEDLGFPESVEDISVQELVAQARLKLSMYPFSQGDPGSMRAVRTPTVPIHCRTAIV